MGEAGRSIDKPRTSKRLKNFLSLSLLGALAVAVILPGTSGDVILGQGDEAMHITTVRYSLANDSVLLPRLPTGVVNAYKPQLLFWMGMLSEEALGGEYGGLAAVRLPSVIAATLTVVFLYLLLLDFRFESHEAFLVAAVYLFTLGVFKFGRLLMMEQSLALFFLACTFFFLRFARSGTLLPLVLSGFLSGIAFWLKGPLFQFYTGMLFIAWGGILMFRFQTHPVEWSGASKLRPLVRALIIFHVSAAIPIALWFALVLFSGEGRLILQFFFVTENIRKFGRENQNEFRILLGWLLYTLPWTPIFMLALIAAFKKKIRSAGALAGRILLLSALFGTLLHLLPNRKDAYYVLPFIAPAFAGTAVLIRGMHRIRQNIRIFGAGFLLFLSTFTGLVVTRLEYSWVDLAAVAVSFTVASVALIFMKRIVSEPGRSFLLAIAGAVWLVSIQVSFLPLFHRPRLPEEVKASLGQEICIVSQNPWDAFDYSTLLPDRKVRHVFPGAPRGCGGNGEAIIAYKWEHKASPPYELKRSWRVWRRDVDIDMVIAFLREGASSEKLYDRVSYFAPSKTGIRKARMNIDDSEIQSPGEEQLKKNRSSYVVH